jgi:RHS repeat-associated protein
MPTYRSGTAGDFFAEDWDSEGDGLGVASAVYQYPTDTTSESDFPQPSEGCSNGTNLGVSHRKWNSANGESTEWATTLTTTCGLVTRSWNRDDQLITTIVDARGNLIESKDNNNQRTKYAYNRRDQLIRVTHPDLNHTTYSYASWNTYGPTSHSDPDRGTTTYTYDGHGRVWLTSDARGVKLRNSYDKANRPTLIEFENASGNWPNVSQYTYDQGVNEYGLLSEARHWNRKTQGNAAGVVTQKYSYDDRGRISSVNHAIPGMPGGSKDVNYSYYEHNQPRHINYPDQVQVTYAYDRQGRQSWLGLTDPARAEPDVTVVAYAEYNASNQLVTLKRGAAGTGQALNTYYAYNAYNGTLRSSYTDSGGNTPLDQQYIYDYSNQGNLWSVFEKHPNGSFTKSCFGYDAVNQMTRAWTLGHTNVCGNGNNGGTGTQPFNITYNYDPATGNITSANGYGTANGTYVYDAEPAHAPSSAGTNTYTYDSAGNRGTATIGGEVFTYDYDAQNRLIYAANNAGTAGMLYSTSGERAKRTIGTETDYYLSSGYELAGSGATTLSLEFADRQVATYDSSNTLWTQNTDHLGTPTFIVSEAGGDGRYHRYTPYGTPRPGASLTPFNPTDLTFTGQRDDGALKLMYYGARYYDPQLSQFTQPDNITIDGLNRYAYVRNNPLRYTDPTGRCASIVDGSVCSYRAQNRSAIAGRINRSNRDGVYVKSLNATSDIELGTLGLLAGAATTMIEPIGTGLDARSCLEGNRVDCGWAFTPFLAGSTVKLIDRAANARRVVGRGPKDIDSLLDQSESIVRRSLGLCSSFSADTTVLMADGSQKPISTVEVGDLVLAADPENGGASTQAVTAVWPHHDWLLDLVLEGGDIVVTTEDHHFWNATDQSWQETQLFDSGDELLAADGNKTRFHKLDWSTLRYGQAFDLTVDGTPTYFVQTGETSALVHNTDGCAPRTIQGLRFADEGAEGFGSMSSFRRAYGSAGPDAQWHHIVEQNPTNLGQFGAESIHNTSNIIALDETIHRQVSGYYSSIQPFTGGQTVRQWVSAQPFDAQHQFGLDVLDMFGAAG